MLRGTKNIDNNGDTQRPIRYFSARTGSEITIFMGLGTKHDGVLYIS